MINLSPKYVEASTPYLEKGLLYIGLVAILLALWIILRYKGYDF